MLNQRERHRANVVIQAQLDEQQSQFPLMAEESWLSSAIKLAMLPQNTLNSTLSSTLGSTLGSTLIKPQHVPTLSKPRSPASFRRILRLKLNRKFRHAKKLNFKNENLFFKARAKRAIQSRKSN